MTCMEEVADFFSIGLVRGKFFRIFVSCFSGHMFIRFFAVCVVCVFVFFVEAMAGENMATQDSLPPVTPVIAEYNGITRVDKLSNESICTEIAPVVKRLMLGRDPWSFLQQVLRPWDSKGYHQISVESNGVKFYTYEKENSISILRQDGKIMEFSPAYYELDIANRGVAQTIEILSDSYKGTAVGGGDILWIYDSLWTSGPQPINAKKLSGLDLEIGYRTFVFSSWLSSGVSFKYYIYPLSLHGKNYLLFESNDTKDVPRFIVSEVSANWDLLLHCVFN